MSFIQLYSRPTFSDPDSQRHSLDGHRTVGRVAGQYAVLDLRVGLTKVTVHRSPTSTMTRVSPPRLRLVVGRRELETTRQLRPRSHKLTFVQSGAKTGSRRQRRHQHPHHRDHSRGSPCSNPDRQRINVTTMPFDPLPVTTPARSEPRTPASGGQGYRVVTETPHSGLELLFNSYLPLVEHSRLGHSVRNEACRVCRHSFSTSTSADFLTRHSSW